MSIQFDQSGNPATFPHFTNDDVLISIPPGEIYHLHADVLRRCSPRFMGKLLAPQHAATLAKAAERAGAKTRFKLELMPSRDHPNGIFVRKGVDKYGQAIPSNMSSYVFFNSMYETPPISQDTIDCWKNLFGTFYNIEPNLKGSSLQTVLEKCVRLMDTAESIDAVVAVRPHVDNALMRQGQLVYRSVLASPIPWGNLALRVHSPTIFNEAVVHLVGKWNSMLKQDKREMDPRLRAVCERKAEELYKIKGAAEMRIAGHIPPDCWRRADRDHISRASYSNDVYMWMAISIRHQWFHQVVGIERRGRDGVDGGARLYKAIYEEGPSYLNAEDYVNFHNLCPMSQKARTILYDKVRQIKWEVRKYVKSLMQNKTQLELNSGAPIDHLLCTKVTAQDYLWNSEDDDTAFVPSELSDGDDEDGEGDRREGGVPPGVSDTLGTEFHPPGSEQTVDQS
ncbi:hypothetical protein PISL3812_04720 [Talaromyces islandicus]|uniref:BTB domain-containing protein n=1 Tax=Talaromyces islandicus TaxID=28573 RepID=A0A0U1LYI0_TALIS|nr:hypothetical protein PISL3812_04720 [Talaromyces islandicus]